MCIFPMLCHLTLPGCNDTPKYGVRRCPPAGMIFVSPMVPDSCHSHTGLLYMAQEYTSSSILGGWCSRARETHMETAGPLICPAIHFLQHAGVCCCAPEETQLICGTTPEPRRLEYPRESSAIIGDSRRFAPLACAHWRVRPVGGGMTHLHC